MKRLLKIVAVVVVLLLVAAVALPFLIDANAFRPELEAKLTQALGRKVDLGDLKLSVLSGGVSATHLSIADDPAFSKTPFVRAQSLNVNVDLAPLILSRKLNVTGVVIDQPEIDLWQTPQGQWNFSSIGGAPPNAAAAPSAKPSAASPAGNVSNLTVKLIKITGGIFSLGKTGGKSKPERLDHVDVELRDFSANAAFPFSFSAAFAGGGSVKLSGQAGPLDSADAAATPFDAKLSISHLDLLASGFVDPATGLAGLASVEGSATSNGNTLAVKGKLTAEGLKLARGGTAAKPPVEVDIAVSHDMKTQGGKLEQGDIHIGKAAASLTGTYALEGEATAVHLKLAGPAMIINDLAAMLPALNISLPSGSSIQGGAAMVELNSDGPLDRLTTTGSLSAKDTTLANFDLGSKLRTLEKFAGIQAGQNTAIQVLSAQVRNSPSGTNIDDLNLIVPSIGTLTGAGTISPAQELDFKLTVTVHASGALLTALGQKGDTQVPLTVTGTASNPVFKPDLKAVVGDKLKNLTSQPTKAADAAKGILNLFKK
jgi:AsmA protein